MTMTMMMMMMMMMMVMIMLMAKFDDTENSTRLFMCSLYRPD